MCGSLTPKSMFYHYECAGRGHRVGCQQKRKAEWPREGEAEKVVDKGVGGLHKSFLPFRLKGPRFLASPLAHLHVSYVESI